jgi:hypothetical protein
MTTGAAGLAGGDAIAYLVATVEFVVTMQFADLVVAIAVRLAPGLGAVASTGASRRGHRCEHEEKDARAHAMALQFERAGAADDGFGSVGFVAPGFHFGA